MIAWLVLIYGILVAAGGVMGYAKSQSTPSLIAGGISGIALVGAAVAHDDEDSHQRGEEAA